MSTFILPNNFVNFILTPINKEASCAKIRAKN